LDLLLTDRLTCPRCGPEFGLILLADRMMDRRVVDGTLGCPNCRDAYPVQAGFGDLRAAPRTALEPGLAGGPREAEPEQIQRLAALLGVARGPGTMALVGGPAALGISLAALFEDVEIVGFDADLSVWPEAPRWSRLTSGPGLPIFSRTLRGVAVDGRLGPAWVVEAARVCASLARVVVSDAPASASSWLREAGLDVMAVEDGTVVAARR
jgi:uncharacterized protein YbaR (Trm112 family)